MNSFLLPDYYFEILRFCYLGYFLFLFILYYQLPKGTQKSHLEKTLNSQAQTKLTYFILPPFHVSITRIIGVMGRGNGSVGAMIEASPGWSHLSFMLFPSFIFMLNCFKSQICTKSHRKMLCK